MQASHDEGDLGSATAAADEAEGLPARASEVTLERGREEKLFVHKPGWQQPVGWALSMWHDWTVHPDTSFTYIRIELKDFHLSHAAALFLLQGASLKNLFDNVVVTVGGREPDIYSLAIADAPRLFAPPPRCPRVVLAHILERPVDMPPEKIFEQLFMREMARSSF